MGINTNNDITKIETYSENETDTGMVWIDGKKIYRKVWTGNIPSSMGACEFCTLPTNAAIIRFWGYVEYNSSPMISRVPIIYYYSSTDNVLAFQATGKILGSIQGTIYLNKPYMITAEYTKTS